MKRLILSVGILLTALVLHAQHANLVPNPSFEGHTGCPVTNQNSVVDLAEPWQSSSLLAPGFGFTSYYHPCGDAAHNVPVNTGGGGFQYPRTDSAYAGFRVYTEGWTNQRGYVQTILDSPLVAGSDYYVEFFVNLNNSKLIAITSIGAYLSVTRPTTPNDSAFNNLINATPQIINPPGNFLNDTASWEKISGIYTALGGEEYITIGNFMPDTLTALQVLLVNSTSSWYYIDDVTVIEQTPTSIDDLVDNDKQVTVFPNPSTGFVNFEIEAKGISGDATVIVMDLSGRIFKALNIELTPPKTTVQMLFDGLSNGLYLYEIVAADHLIGYDKIIIR